MLRVLRTSHLHFSALIRSLISGLNGTKGSGRNILQGLGRGRNIWHHTMTGDAWIIAHIFRSSAGIASKYLLDNTPTTTFTW
jgi:hypothetical protein